MRYGIVYCAFYKYRYVIEAFLAAHSVRTLTTHIPIVLFTNFDDTFIKDCALFDQVKYMRMDHAFVNEWITGKLPRISSMMETPFERTLHLDCDTRVNSTRFMEIFDIVGHHDIAMARCQLDTSFTRRHYRKPVFNCGVVGYRNTTNVMNLFNDWRQLTIRHHQWSEAAALPCIPYLEHISRTRIKRKLLGMDQISMAQLLRPDAPRRGLNALELEEAWNARKYRPSLDDHNIIVKHFSTFHNTALADFGRLMSALRQAGHTALYKNCSFLAAAHNNQ